MRMLCTWGFAPLSHTFVELAGFFTFQLRPYSKVRCGAIAKDMVALGVCYCRWAKKGKAEAESKVPNAHPMPSSEAAAIDAASRSLHSGKPAPQ